MLELLELESLVPFDDPAALEVHCIRSVKEPSVTATRTVLAILLHSLELELLLSPLAAPALDPPINPSPPLDDPVLAVCRGSRATTAGEGAIKGAARAKAKINNTVESEESW